MDLWRSEGLELSVGVNIAARDLTDPTFGAWVGDSAAASCRDPSTRRRSTPTN